MYLVQALTLPNTYFLFRELDDVTCLEIRVIVSNNKIVASHELKAWELTHVQDKVLKKNVTL